MLRAYNPDEIEPLNLLKLVLVGDSGVGVCVFFSVTIFAVSHGIYLMRGCSASENIYFDQVCRRRVLEQVHLHDWGGFQGP